MLTTLTPPTMTELYTQARRPFRTWLGPHGGELELWRWAGEDWILDVMAETVRRAADDDWRMTHEVQ